MGGDGQNPLVCKGLETQSEGDRDPGVGGGAETRGYEGSRGWRPWGGLSRSRVHAEVKRIKATGQGSPKSEVGVKDPRGQDQQRRLPHLSAAG